MVSLKSSIKHSLGTKSGDDVDALHFSFGAFLLTLKYHMDVRLVQVEQNFFEAYIPIGLAKILPIRIMT